MTPKLRSRSGCLTCVARKKKCDEAVPRCGLCVRLNLSCLQRKDATGSQSRLSISSTCLRARKPAPQLQRPVSNGYPAFKDVTEQRLTVASSRLLGQFVSHLARPEYQDLAIIPTAATQVVLVRDAVIAFAVYLQRDKYSDSYQRSIRCYQRCIKALTKSRLYQSSCSAERNLALLATLFIGLLEVSDAGCTSMLKCSTCHQGLCLGNPVNTEIHFEACRKMLLLQAPHVRDSTDANMLAFYRIVAESIMFNLGTFSLFHPQARTATADWGHAFEDLFPGALMKHRDSSPFFGGFPNIYRVMLNITLFFQEPAGRRKCQPRRRRRE